LPREKARSSQTFTTVNGVPVRLSAERWLHIVEHHDDLAGYHHSVLETVARPESVHEGDSGELLAVSGLSGGRALIVAYRELSAEEGFVITAFFTSRVRQIERRRRLWTRQSS
jgi:hypothetical protein